MKAILTKYIGPTNTRPSRIRASDCDGNSVTISYPHELSGEAAFRKAADALCLKMGWKGPLVGGGLKNDWVFCFADGCPEVIALRGATQTCVEMLSESLRTSASNDQADAIDTALWSTHTALQPFTR